MSKILEATCSASGVVTSDSLTVEAEVLSEGNQASSGLLILEEASAWYLTSSATDIKSTLERVASALEDLESALTTVANTLTAIGAGMTGPTTAPPPTLATDVSSIISKVAEVTATRGQINTLKDALK